MGRRSNEARIFAAGVLCGLLAGLIPAGLLAWRYAHPHPGTNGQRIAERAPEAHRPPVARPAPGSAAVDWADGMAAPGGATVPVDPRPAPTSGNGRPLSADVNELAARDLAVPVEGVPPDQLVRSFEDERTGGRVHEALDILAARNTPVRAVEDGRIVKLFTSKAGGITVYQFDPTERYCYYYAHLDRYASGLQEGQPVKQGELIGYVGTSGNAPKNTPHLHFAIFKLGPEKRWWEGAPIDPYDVLR